MYTCSQKQETRFKKKIYELNLFLFKKYCNQNVPLPVRPWARQNIFQVRTFQLENNIYLFFILERAES